MLSKHKANLIPLLALSLAPVLAAGQVAASLPDKPTGRPDANLVAILVAKKDIRRDTFLTKPADVLEVKHVPFEAAPKGSYHSFADIQDQMLVNRIDKGEILTHHHLLDAGPKTFCVELPPGTIPFTVRMDPANAPAQPADRMHLVHVTSNGMDGVKATTILQKVLVLKVDYDAAPAGQKMETLVVVAVFPVQAKLLKKAGSEGSWAMSRPRYGEDFVDSRPTTLKELLKQQRGRDR